MAGYIVRRVLLIIPVVWGAMTLLFMAFLLPGDPVDALSGERAPTAIVRRQITEKYGLDQPVHVRYGRYMGDVLQGDLGHSYKQGRTVNAILKQTAPNSLRLATWAIILEVVIGLTAGIISAVRQYSFLDTWVTVTTTMVVAIPVFVLGYLFQYTLGVYTFEQGFPEWLRFPTSGIGPNKWGLGIIPLGGQWKYLLLPAVTLASVSSAIVARMTRTTMLEVMKADYMRTAVAKGLSQRRVILQHGLKNAMIPVVTLIGLDLASLIGSAVLTETVFNWPGMGRPSPVPRESLDAPVVLGLPSSS